VSTLEQSFSSTACSKYRVKVKDSLVDGLSGFAIHKKNKEREKEKRIKGILPASSDWRNNFFKVFCTRRKRSGRLRAGQLHIISTCAGTCAERRSEFIKLSAKTCVELRISARKVQRANFVISKRVAISLFSPRARAVPSHEAKLFL